ncbi:MAG: polysaccharide biosynthesis protein [Acidobacteria bacterium]|nr:polysaccharide biosynthesis protein [Acidobacteriota bacterium]
MNNFSGKRILITGGTGSLGRHLVRRILTGEMGLPAKVIVFSRDEAKQHRMRLDHLNRTAATDEVIYDDAGDRLTFRIGDVRDYHAVVAALRGADIVFNAAALKQVPSCEYFPYEAVQTNIDGAENIVRAIVEHDLPIETVVGISTDKACKPVNVMGMTKAVQERIFIEANRNCKNTRLMCVRYGNVIASRGSIIPLFAEQIRENRPLTVTLPEMTRFFCTLDSAVDTVFEAVRSGRAGDTFVPIIPAAKMVDIAKAMMGDRDLPIAFTGIRPGEKIHEVMVSEEECFRTIRRGDHYIVLPVLPELRTSEDFTPALSKEFSSRDDNLTVQELKILLGVAEKEIASAGRV